MGFRTIFSLGLIVSLLSGCGATVGRQAFNREVGVSLQSVAVTERSEPEEYSVMIMGHPGLSFGLVGGLIAMADMKAKGTRLNKALDPAQTGLRRRLSSQIAQELGQNGYQTKVLPLKADVEDKELIAVVSKDDQSDMVLSLKFQASYVAAGPSTPYYPYVSAHVVATVRSTSKVVYEDWLTYGYSFPNTKAVHFPSEDKYAFADMEALETQPEQARAALTVGVDTLVAQIVRDLKKN